MLKKIILVLAALLLMCASAGCIAEEENVMSDRYIYNDKYYGYYIYIYVDDLTGVEYLIYHEDVVYGGCGGISPRYNADGTLKINEEFRK